MIRKFKSRNEDFDEVSTWDGAFVLRDGREGWLVVICDGEPLREQDKWPIALRFVRKGPMPLHPDSSLWEDAEWDEANLPPWSVFGEDRVHWALMASWLDKMPSVVKTWAFGRNPPASYKEWLDLVWWAGGPPHKVS